MENTLLEIRWQWRILCWRFSRVCSFYRFGGDRNLFGSPPPVRTTTKPPSTPNAPVKRKSSVYRFGGDGLARNLFGSPPVSPQEAERKRKVPPMGLFYPQLLVPDEYPLPPRSWFNDHEDMLEDTWHMEYSRRSDMSDSLFPGISGGLSMWDNYPVFSTKLKKEDNLGLAEAITSSILSTGRIDLQRKLFCSIQLIGGVALTGGLVAAVEERVLHAIPSNEAIDTVEVLQSRTDPTFISWKGGALLGILDFGRDAWIHREDWIHSGIHIASGRKYKDSFFLQAQAMCYINS